ncbi:MAG: hypothetical protein Kow0079_04650 [Vicingaceae bacterium]
MNKLKINKMKNLNLLVIAGVIGIFTSCSKEKQSVDNQNASINNNGIPENVLKTFNQNYPEAKNVEWEMEGNNYEAVYTENNLEKSIVYNKEGVIILTETQINITDLSENIKNYINENYPASEIEKAEKEDSNEGVFYEVEIINDNDEVELVFDSNGNFLKVEKDDEDDMDDDENEKSIEVSQLPESISKAIFQRYNNAKLIEADEITHEDGSITYDIEIENNGENFEVMYDINGNYMGVEQDDYDDNDDENED